VCFTEGSLTPLVLGLTFRARVLIDGFHAVHINGEFEPRNWGTDQPELWALVLITGVS
jgi:hypothetical protein